MNRDMRLIMAAMLMLVIGMSSCSSSDDEELREIDTIVPATPLQKAFYLTEEDTQQPLWLQKKIKETPYLKVYHTTDNCWSVSLPRTRPP